jgi:hypothetical protein
MQSEVKTAGNLSSSNSEPEAFRMLVVFDSEQAGKDARLASEHILSEVGTEVAVQSSFFDARNFGLSAAADTSLSEAASADVILIALSRAEIESNMKQWTEFWLKKRENDTGLLAFIPEGDFARDYDFTEFLRQTAISANMDFVCRCGENRVNPS